MLQMKGTKPDGRQFHILVLETKNLEEIQKGRPVVSPDKAVMICWTPDPVWLADKLQETGGDVTAIARLIDEAAKRPQKPSDRPAHGAHVKDFAAERGEAPKAFEVRSSHGRGWIVGDAPECEKFDYRTEAELYAELRRQGWPHLAAWEKIRDSVVTPRKEREARLRKEKEESGGDAYAVLGGEG